MKNLKEYGIVELHDGLTLEIIKEKHSWLLSAQVSLAVIGLDGETIVWKSGIWEGGRWEFGIWEGGRWESGIWEGGVWKGGVWESGVWEDGVWESGIWEDGLWQYGRWLDGVWKGGYRFSEKSPK